jgi:hypothetical protein
MSVTIAGAAKVPSTLSSTAPPSADPVNFPIAVECATGVNPQLPEHLAGIMQQTERMVGVANCQKTMERHI